MNPPPAIRIVLARHPRDGWRLYRQAHWIGEVRRDPSAASWPRRHFDLDASAYLAARDDWITAGAPASLDAALATLARLGGLEIRPSANPPTLPNDPEPPEPRGSSGIAGGLPGQRSTPTMSFSKRTRGPAPPPRPTRRNRAMPTLTIEGDDKTVSVAAGTKLVLAIEDAGIDIMHRCGGNARCTTCRVEVLAGDPGPMGDAEQARLASETNLPAGTRLSCQIRVLDDLTVRVINHASAVGVSPGPRPAD